MGGDSYSIILNFSPSCHAFLAHLGARVGVVMARVTEGEEGNQSHEGKRSAVPFTMTTALLNVSRGDQPRGCRNRSPERSCLQRIRRGGRGEIGLMKRGLKKGQKEEMESERVQRKAMGCTWQILRGAGGDGVADGESLHFQGVEGQESLDCLE